MKIERKYDNTSNVNPTNLIYNQFTDNFICNYLNNLYNEIEVNLTTSDIKEVV